MALIRLDHLPETVKVNLPLNIILPDPVRMGGIPVRQRKLLYLLHGLSDDGSAWQRYSAIETYAQAYGLVVVMPSVGRSFYTDLPNGQAYFTYLVEELPQYLQDVFALNPKREDTFLAGLSMGGYGAMKAALLYPHLYQAVASFSGMLSLNFLNSQPDDRRHDEFSILFGDLKQLPGSQHDPAVWLQQAAAQQRDLPELYIACGRQDDLYPLNTYFHQACQRLGVDVNYHEEDGQHDWQFWDKQLKRFLQAVFGPLP